MGNIKVSIIIPVYNTEKYLSDCLNSVINQSLEDIEIICINDGSTDNSLNILEEFSKKDNRISIISKENGGQAIARNIGISKARGQYIGFVDSDDYIDERMFEKLYNQAISNDLDINMCKVSTFVDGTDEIDDNLWYYSLGVFKNFDKEIFSHKDTKEFTCEISVTPINKLYKKSFIDNNNIKFAEGYIFEDEVFFFDAYLKAKRVSILNDNLYYYRTDREGSTVEKTSNNNYIDIISIFRLVREKFKETDNYETYKVLLSNRFIHLILWRYSQTDKKYRENFFNLMKEDFNILFEDDTIKDSLSISLKDRVNKVLDSEDYSEFLIKDKFKLFSIVIATFNAENYISEAIDSIINQSFGFENNVQLIIVDDGSTDNTSKICEDYVNNFPDNIMYLYQDNQGQASARNFGLSYASGKYVNFLDSDDKLNTDTLLAVYNFFEKHYDEIDLVSVKISFFDRQWNQHPLNYKYENDAVINLNDNYDYPQLSASSAFFKREVFDSFEFDTNIVSSEDSIMINKLLLNKMAYGVITEGEYYYRKRNDESSTIDLTKFKKEFYINRLKNYFIELINYSIDKRGWVPKFIQYTLLYDLQWLIQIPEVNNVLSDDEFFEFISLLKFVLCYIDDDIILKLRNDLFNVGKHLLTLKYNVEYEIIDNQPTILANDKKIDVLNWHKFYLDILEIRGDKLFISGYLNSFFDKEDLEIYALKKDSNNILKFKGSYYYYPVRNTKILGNPKESNYSFDIVIPIVNNELSSIELFVKFKDISIKLPIAFEKHARLSDECNYSINGNHMIEFINNSFIISPYSCKKFINKEISFLKNIKKNNINLYRGIFKFRLAYIFLFLFFRNKRIWLFMDRIDRADDNAEHLFKYSISQEDGIKKYFVVSDNSEDYERLKNVGNIVSYNSRKHRLLFLFAEKIISSHPDENVINPFWNNHLELYSGCICSDKIFLQHGITKDNVSNWLHKYDKNLKLLITAAKIEYESFFKYPYNYDDKTVQLLGFPRYDNLNKVKTKKQILIMPSWRESLFNKNNYQISNSEYFNRINSLINNKLLLDLAKEHGYVIIFKPHPNVYKFIDLFDKNDQVIFDKGTDYQTLINESALMITDYSSVAFDFAYIEKPVIYYQYGDDYNFDETFFDYEKMGFGEVVDNEKLLIDVLSQYLLNDCIMKQKYLDRIKIFYNFHDSKNCKRVYDAMIDL